MPRYDIENLTADLLAIVTANLNTKLTSIDSEKSDGTTLLQWDTAKAFFQDLDKADAAASPLFLFYGLDDPVADSNGAATAFTIDYFFILVLQDTGENKTYMTRLLRYMRAMYEIFQDNYTKNLRVSRLRVTSLSPVSFSVDGSGSFKATGVKIRAVLA